MVNKNSTRESTINVAEPIHTKTAPRVESCHQPLQAYEFGKDQGLGWCFFLSHGDRQGYSLFSCSAQPLAKYRECGHMRIVLERTVV